MIDPRALSHEELESIRSSLYRTWLPKTDAIKLVQYIDLLHELVMPITGLFLQREQEKMGWKQAGLPQVERDEVRNF